MGLYSPICYRYLQHHYAGNMKRSHPIIRCGLGQSSHRFLPSDSTKPCSIAGVIFDDVSGFQSDSDGDVVYHAICNAISSLIHTPILSGIAHELFLKEGITESEVYVKEACRLLNKQNISHVSISLEAKKPQLSEYFVTMRQNIARALNIDLDQVGISAIFGDGLTDVACGDGVTCLALVTTEER